MDGKLNITLLAGGISAERDVSLNTGAQIHKALVEAGHHVVMSDIGPDNLSALDRLCDLVFPALHGTWGEDGGLQTILEKRGVPFVGSGSAASRMGFDKAATKSALLEHNIPTANWQVVYSHKFKDNWTPAAGIGYPCVLKPVCEGSSVGVKICHNLQEAIGHLRAMFEKKYNAMLVEQFIDGHELTVGILDGKPLPVIRIVPNATFYDYEAKYHRDDTNYEFNIELPARVIEDVSRVAEMTHRYVGARHLSRIDVLVDKHSLAPYVLEINTMPGFTTHSLVPKAAQKAGISFVELCDRLARMALRDAKVML